MNSTRVWLITGSNSGLGLALAQHVLSQGDQVIAAARDLSKLPTSLKDAKPLKIDLSASESEIKKAGQDALKIYGKIDVLVNNAGWCLTGPGEELVDSEIKDQFQANLFGPISLMQALLPSFREREAGHILNVSSIAGFAGGPGCGAYNASKAALEHFSDALSTEVQPFGIRVIVVQPGYFPTNFLNTAGNTAPSSDRATGVYKPFPSDTMDQTHINAGQVGDVLKAAARMFEVVSGTGLAKGLVESHGGKREWTRLQLGPDCGKRSLAKIKLLRENVEAFEPIWSSTDMSEDQVKEFAKRRA